MTWLVDTHAHIDLPVFDEDREAMLQRARGASVAAIIAIGHNPERWRTTSELCSQRPNILRTAGVHPNDAGSWSSETRGALERELASGEPIAVGETGLDFFRNTAPEDKQRAAFVAQIELARVFDLPIVIHQRAAEEQVLEALRVHGPVRGVMHCFSGDAAFAERCLELGMHLGVGGVATYPKSESVRDALRAVSLDSIVLETDAPYLAPQAWRGRRNEPAYLVAAVETLAALHDTPVETIAARTTANASRLFGPRLSAAMQAKDSLR